MGKAWISVYELQQHTFLVVSQILVCYCGIVHEATVGILATEAVLCTILHIASATSNRLQVNLFFVHYNGSAMHHSAHCTNNQPKIASTACSLYL